MQHKWPAVGNDPPVNGGSSGPGPEEKHMIGDFDSGANGLWTLYGKEAKSHDEAQIQTLKEDMDGVLVFVRPWLVHARVESC